MSADQEFYRQLAACIRDQRDQLGLTQGALAERLGLSRTSVTNIEGGQQGLALHTFVTLARSLEMHPGDLLERALIEQPDLNAVDKWVRSLVEPNTATAGDLSPDNLQQ